MTESADRTEFLFAEALVLPVEQRTAYLERECANDSALLKQIQALLRAHERANHLLDQPAGGRGDQTEIHVSQVQNVGDFVGGRYKLLEQIGTGGMGAVWMAEQKEPVKRKVAIKLVKAGMDSAQVLARFEAERQALALMDHPNIAKVFDGGVTEQGRPFFVMEFVKGVPLTEYCNEARLSLKERLNLFVPVCQAVQHAHQKGIIHRDLKPSNILICLYDGKPVPKVIDFGLAKAMHQSLTDTTIHTAFGMMVGTPLYMSPEQAEHNNLDVDTRTDVYSLGVILYELLTGTTPLEQKQLKEAAYNEILRLIKEVEPPKPSTRLSGSVSLPRIAAQRSIEPKQLSKSLTGDLDWIVMKSLDKERSRRYETANGLARDVERFLNDEAVEASPPSSSYRLKKLMRKHRTAINTAAAFAGMLILGTVISVWLAIRATNAEADAKDALVAEAKQRTLAETNERIANEQRAKAEANFKKAREAVDEYFTKVSESKLLNVPGLQPLRKELLESSRKYYQGFLKERSNDPSVRAEAAEAWYRVGFVTIAINPGQEALDAFQKAVEMYDALAREHRDVERYSYKLAMCLNDLGNQQADLGQETEAYKTHERCLAIRKQLVQERPDVAEYQKELGIGYRVWAMRQFSAGKTYDSLRSNEQARDLFERLVREHPHVADYQWRLIGTLEALAWSELRIGRSDQAMPLFLQALTHSERLDRENPDVVDYQAQVISSLMSIAWSHYRLFGRNEDALASYLKAKALAEKIVRDNPDLVTAGARVARLDHEIGRVLVRLGRLEEALIHYRSVLDFGEKQAQNDAGSILSQRKLAYLHLELGRLHQAAGREPEALESLTKARTIFEVLADSHAIDPYNRACMLALSAELVGLGRSDLSAEEQAQRRALSERAIATLREAAAGGYHSPAMISSDTDFDSLRERADFKTLLADLEKKYPAPTIEAASSETP